MQAEQPYPESETPMRPEALLTNAERIFSGSATAGFWFNFAGAGGAESRPWRFQEQYR
jgi:hypothetical protein